VLLGEWGMHLAPPIVQETLARSRKASQNRDPWRLLARDRPEVSDDRCTMLFYRLIEGAVATEPQP